MVDCNRRPEIELLLIMMPSNVLSGKLACASALGVTASCTPAVSSTVQFLVNDTVAFWARSASVIPSSVATPNAQ